VNSQTGEAAGETLQADLTVTMAAAKMGLVRLPALGLVGELLLVEIGLPDGIESWEGIRREVVDEGRVRSLVPKRPLDAHKGTFGTVLVIGGSVSYTGAPLLTGTAAYRAGAGLVTLAVPEPLHPALSGHFPEATWLVLPHEGGTISPAGVKIVLDYLERVTALAVGPGLGLSEPTLQFLDDLLHSGEYSLWCNVVGGDGTGGKSRGLVFDADGLKLLARLPEWADLLPAPSVLTPHPGEMAILTGLDKREIQEHRMEVAERYSAEWGHVVVLKGAGTVVASPDGRTGVIPVATPALARAGTGDVLTGIIAGLLAQGADPYESAILGAWLHAQAGLISSDLIGSEGAVLAGDVLDALPEVIQIV
jgi:NAD(P)H-hydrate epimerase